MTIRTLLSAFGFVVVLQNALFAQAITPWKYIVVEVREKVGCINDPVTEVKEYILPANEPDYTALKNILKQDLQARYDGRAVVAGEYTLRPDRPFATALVETAHMCPQWNGPKKPVKSLRLHVGKDSLGLDSRVQGQRVEYSADMNIVRWMTNWMSEIIKADVHYKEGMPMKPRPFDVGSIRN